MNRLDNKTRVLITKLLVEGNSVRATARIADVSKNTVTKLLVALGEVCSEYQDKALRNLPCQQIEVDEIWSFCYSKQKNVPVSMKGQFGVGDVWTWTAIDAETKLVPSWLVGDRDGYTAGAFIKDLASRLASRVQLTSDGLKLYVQAVEDAFGCDIDFAQLIKQYGGEGSNRNPETRYSPAVCTGVEKIAVTGRPDEALVSTSYVERQNLTMRMSMRRFTRLTNAFSKKVQNHAAAIALHFFHYNFCRIHSSLRVTPAMAAKVTDRLWEVSDLVAMLVAREDAEEAEKGPRRTRNKPKTNEGAEG